MIHLRRRRLPPLLVASPASGLPGGVAAVVDGYAAQCRQLGGRMVGAAAPLTMTADLDGDGQPDYVLDPVNLQCSGSATAFCGNGGCGIDVALSAQRYARRIEVLGGNPSLTLTGDGAVLLVLVDAANCNVPKWEKACLATYAWPQGKARLTYRAIPLTN